MNETPPDHMTLIRPDNQIVGVKIYVYTLNDDTSKRAIQQLDKLGISYYLCRVDEAPPDEQERLARELIEEGWTLTPVIRAFLRERLFEWQDAAPAPIVELSKVLNTFRELDMQDAD